MERIVIRVRYRIDNRPWLIADSPDQVPPGAELHPCHLQREILYTAFSRPLYWLGVKTEINTV